MFIFASLDSTSVNTILIVVVAFVVGFFTLIRGRADVWKSNYEGEKTRADDATAEVLKLKIQVAELESKPDVSKLYELIAEHDKVSTAQNIAITKALELLTKKIKEQ